MNCLSYALRFWDKMPQYKMYYNSDHVINAKSPITGDNYLAVEYFGYDYFISAFEGLLTEKDEKLLKKYFGHIKKKP